MPFIGVIIPVITGSFLPILLANQHDYLFNYFLGRLVHRQSLACSSKKCWQREVYGYQLRMEDLDGPPIIQGKGWKKQHPGKVGFDFQPASLEVESLIAIWESS